MSDSDVVIVFGRNTEASLNRFLAGVKFKLIYDYFYVGMSSMIKAINIGLSWLITWND